MLIAVVGANGLVGSECVKYARTAGHRVTALLRDLLQARRLSDWGAGVAWADIEDCELVPYIAISAGVVIDATKFRFDQDVQQSISLSDYKDGYLSPVLNVWSREIQAKISVIEAVKLLGIPRYIYFSPKISSVTELDELTQSSLIEEYLIQSGLNYTIVTFECHLPGALWETLSTLNSETEEPILRVLGGKPLSLVSKEDLARAACLAIFSKRCEHTQLWIQGPGFWPPLDIAKFIIKSFGEAATRLKSVIYFYVMGLSSLLSFILDEWPKVHKLKIYSALISNGIMRRQSRQAQTFTTEGKRWIRPCRREGSFRTTPTAGPQGGTTNGSLLRLFKTYHDSKNANSLSGIGLPLLAIREDEFQAFEAFLARARKSSTGPQGKKHSKTRTKDTDEQPIL
jgi:hypothetical protein